MKDFYSKFNALKNNYDSFNLVDLKSVSTDFILFYKEGSQIPLHATFVNFDCQAADVNVELEKCEILLDISAYFNNMLISHKFRSIKPRFRILTRQEREELVRFHGFNELELKRFNRLVIKEYFKGVFHLMRYQDFCSHKLLPQHAKTLVLKKHCRFSKLHLLQYGSQYPAYFDRYSFQQLFREREQRKDRKKKEDKAKGIQQILQEQGRALSNRKEVRVLSKIHIHLRCRMNLKLNILKRESKEPMHTLYIHDGVLDLMNPIANLRLKVMMQLRELKLLASKDQFTQQRQKRYEIFSRSRVQAPRESQRGHPIVTFRDLKLSFNVSFQQGKDNKLVVLLYSKNEVGPFTYNHYPAIFSRLIRDLLQLMKITKKNFRIKFDQKALNIRRDFKRRKFYVHSKNAVSKIKQSVQERLVKKMNDSQFSRQSHSRHYSLQQQQENFEGVERRRKQEAMEEIERIKNNTMVQKVL